VKRKRIAKFLVLFATVYVATYLALSTTGTYRPNTIGLNGIQDWFWSPKYFADDFGTLRKGWACAFLPLYWLDLHYWHNDWTGENGPRHEILPPRKRSALSVTNAPPTQAR
jgi:hypothetical protein